MRFLVTTDASRVQLDKPVLVLDGTIPGLEHPHKDNPLLCQHYDHHANGGARIQLLEIPAVVPPMDLSELQICTTMCDADAMASAVLWLARRKGFNISQDSYERLYAIAEDCDWLETENKSLSKFSADVVVTLKESALSVSDYLDIRLPTDLPLEPASLSLHDVKSWPKNRQKWTEDQKTAYNSLVFERGTIWLLEALIGKRPWPIDEALIKSYWRKQERIIQEICYDRRIMQYRDCMIFHGAGLKYGYIDPRAWLIAMERMHIKPAYSITVTSRVMSKERRRIGTAYTLGTIPSHPHQKKVDFNAADVYFKLTLAEALERFGPTRNFDLTTDFDAAGINRWGGRKTVGGSGWNLPSRLSPHQIIDVVLKALK